MSDTISVSITLEQSVREVLSASDLPFGSNEADRTLRHTALNKSVTLSATSVPKAQRAVLQDVTIGAGITTIDFTAAPKSVSRTEDMTGKKVTACKIVTGSLNAGNVTIAHGASNPYPLFGTAKDVILGPGRTEQFAFADGVDSNLPAVAGGAKTIDISGTAADTVRLELIFGT